MNIFVHLPEYYCSNKWAKVRDEGRLVGVNEFKAYGYNLVEGNNVRIVYSTFYDEGRLGKLIRLGGRVLTGFDVVHAWRNRAEILAADVVWTHTESHFLGVAFVCVVTRHKQSPKIIGQSVWLYDGWHKMSVIRQKWYRLLMSRVDVLTVHSPLNLIVAEKLFATHICALVRFGINSAILRTPQKRSVDTPLRVLSLGSDRDRDWITLIEASGNLNGCDVRIGSRKVSKRLLKGVQNISVVHLNTASEFEKLMLWADVMVLAISPNLHASGVTCLQEAAVYGIPSICSDVGGLRSYFNEEEVCYVPPSDSDAMRDAILRLANDESMRLGFAEKAQQRMLTGELSSLSFSQHHLELSRKVLEG